MKCFSKVLFATLLLVFLAGGLFADSTIHKGDDYTVEIKGDKVVFTLTRAGVTKAAIPGFFNGWKPEAPEAQMQEKDGKWVLEIDLATFTKATPYEFKFHTNGDWDQGGNKALNLAKKQGAWVFAVSAADAVKPNTKNSTDIEFYGHTSGLIRYAKNAIVGSDWSVGDGDFYFDNSYIDLDIGMKFKVGNKIVGNAILNYNINQNTGSKTLMLDKYKTMIDLELLTINLFYRERVVEFMNPSRGLDKFSASLANNIFFFKESAGEIGKFGRNYMGLLGTMSLFNGELMALVSRDNTPKILNSVMAARYYNNSLVGKKLGFGLSLVYEKYFDPVSKGEQKFMGMLDPNRIYISYFSRYFEYQLGADVDFSFGDLSIFAEGKGVIYCNESVVGADNLMDIHVLAGAKYTAGALKFELVLGDIIRDELFIAGEDLMYITGKFGFFTKTTEWKLQVSAYLYETSKMLLNARVNGKLETSFFDLFVDGSYIGQDVYMSVDARAWIEWYLNSKLRLVGGGRIAMYENTGFAMRSYINPYAGLAFKPDKAFSFKLYFGLNPEYSLYREDKGYTIDDYMGIRSHIIDANYLKKENLMMKNLAIQLEVDASF